MVMSGCHGNERPLPVSWLDVENVLVSVDHSIEHSCQHVAMDTRTRLIWGGRRCGEMSEEGRRRRWV